MALPFRPFTKARHPLNAATRKGAAVRQAEVSKRIEGEQAPAPSRLAARLSLATSQGSAFFNTEPRSQDSGISYANLDSLSIPNDESKETTLTGHGFSECPLCPPGTVRCAHFDGNLVRLMCNDEDYWGVNEQRPEACFPQWSSRLTVWSYPGTGNEARAIYDDAERALLAGEWE